MMIKVSNEFLDFNEQIEVEKQIKLFEDISTTDGDFSYAFDLPKTLNNTRLLQNPFPDNINKLVYQQIPAKVLSDSGAELYDGYLRIERVTDVYSCSFFAGNNNWFAMIGGLLSELDLSRFDIEQTVAEIEYSWSLNDGIVFPLVDNGGLLTRSYPQIKVEDLVGAFYVKTIFNQIFVEAGIKIQGELLNDWMYQNTVCLKNSKSEEEINARSSFIEKTSAQTITTTPTVIIWDNDSVFPYFDGDENLFNLPINQYQPDVGMILNINVSLNITRVSIAIVAHVFTYIYINGVQVFVKDNQLQPTFSSQVIAPTFKVKVLSGDIVEVLTSSNIGTPLEASITSGTLKITPSFIYKTFGKSAVPNWTKQKFVSNILRLFNVLASYEAGNKTLTLNLFEKIKSKPAIDLSEYISETEVDYSEFISDYGKRSKLSYNEVEFKELKDNNVGQFFKYGQGVIEVNNDFLEDDVDIIESDFSNPLAYINGVLDMSIEKTNLLELEEGENTNITSVTDASGNARFNIPEDIFLVGDLVRIEESTNTSYNGDWVVTGTAAGWIECLGTGFDTNATATVTKMDYTYSNSDDVYLLVNIPSYSITKFSGNEFIFLEDTGKSTFAVAYFDLINTNRQINVDFIYSLSFGGIDDPLHYQITMIEQYFRLLRQVLNDPVKLLSTAHLPYALFVQIDFLSPIKVLTEQTQNVYYLNRITGYSESFLPTTLELIKL